MADGVRASLSAIVSIGVPVETSRRSSSSSELVQTLEPFLIGPLFPEPDLDHPAANAICKRPNGLADKSTERYQPCRERGAPTESLEHLSDSFSRRA